MLEDLDRIVTEISSLNSKLVLLIGPPRSGKSVLLSALAKRREAAVLRSFSDACQDSAGSHFTLSPDRKLSDHTSKFVVQALAAFDQR